MSLIGDQTVHLDANWKAVFDNFGELYHVEHIHPQHEKMFDCPTAEIDLFARGHTGVMIDGHVGQHHASTSPTSRRVPSAALRRYGVDPADVRAGSVTFAHDVQQSATRTGPRLGYDYASFSDERLTDIEQYNVFPNTMITVQPDSASSCALARPHRPASGACGTSSPSTASPSQAVAEPPASRSNRTRTTPVAPIERPDAR